MSHLLLLTATGGLLAAILWLGKDRSDLLLHTMLRPALLALMGLLLLLIVPESTARWPYFLVAAASGIGLWESYSGVYRLLAAPVWRTGPVEQVKISATWLVNALANLMLLNLAIHLAYPGTFLWQNRAASPLDVAYFTLLTFASGGYGDVLPATPMGKGLAMLTSLSGLTYATILFAALFQRLRAD